MIRTYIDSKFIKNFKTQFDSSNKYSSDFDLLKSLYNFLTKNKKNELFLAERNIKIKADELSAIIFRDGETPYSKMKTEDYVINEKYDFSTITKSTVLFFINFNNNDIDNLTSNYGVFFTNKGKLMQKWRKLTLFNNFSKSLTISFRQFTIENKFDYNSFFGHYCLDLNSLLFVDRFLRGWSIIDIKRNLIPLLDAIIFGKKCKKYHLTVITTEQDKERYRHTLIELSDVIKTELDRKINLEFSMICIDEDAYYGKLQSEIKNVIHDRHLISNYLQITNLHSFDILKHQKVKKDSEIILKSLIGSSNFSNYDKKRKSYLQLFSDLEEENSNGITCIGNYKDNLIFKEII